MLRKPLIGLVSKYSFVDNCEQKGIYFYIYYTNKGVKKHKRLPIRSSLNKLQDLIKSISDELGIGKYGKARIGQIYTT